MIQDGLKIRAGRPLRPEMFLATKTVNDTLHHYMGSEDFAFMLQKKQGTDCMLGNGDGYMVHHPEYIFNQDRRNIDI